MEKHQSGHEIIKKLNFGGVFVLFSFKSENILGFCEHSVFANEAFIQEIQSWENR